MLPFFAWKIFSISFFISLDFYLQVLMKPFPVFVLEICLIFCFALRFQAL